MSETKKVSIWVIFFNLAPAVFAAFAGSMFAETGKSYWVGFCIFASLFTIWVVIICVARTLNSKEIC